MSKKIYVLFSSLFVTLSFVALIWGERTTVVPCGLAALTCATLAGNVD